MPPLREGVQTEIRAEATPRKSRQGRLVCAALSVSGVRVCEMVEEQEPLHEPLRNGARYFPLNCPVSRLAKGVQ